LALLELAAEMSREGAPLCRGMRRVMRKQSLERESCGYSLVAFSLKSKTINDSLLTRNVYGRIFFAIDINVD